MALRSLSLPFYVTTSEHDPVKEFFDPVFERAKRYDVAVGYFSSAWLRDAAHGISRFALNGGRARWIISPELSPEDLQSLRADKKIADARMRDVISRSYEDLFQQLTQRTREALGWLIRDEILTFKIGIPRNRLSGILHAKQGLFTDENGDRVGFLGSYNLTGGAGTNWEAFSVFCDWSSQESIERNSSIASSFEKMWNRLDPNLSLYDPSEADLERFVSEARKSRRKYDLFPTEKPRWPRVPEHFLSDGRLRDYQEEGIQNWFKSNGRGMLHMATGTGKTVTALTAITRLNDFVAQKKGELCSVIAVPYQHLAEQWAREAESFGFEPVLCYGGLDRWKGAAQGQLNELRAKSRQLAMLIVVNASLKGKPFQSILRAYSGNLLFIGDEMHNLGARTGLEALPNHAAFRLGLSATPDRYGDEEGTAALKRYFGAPVLEFGLDKAIEGGYLCRYLYYPILIHLDEEEQAEYDEISIQIGKMFAQSADSDSAENDHLNLLLIKRARLVGRARNKLPALLELLQQQQDVSHTLIYCGDSKDGGARYIDTALETVGVKLGLRASVFTSRENNAERAELLSLFSSGEIQVLLAIRCLDEGVDVPMTRTAYILASSANPKEFIQRRGRVLRRAEGKSRAYIYDFIVTPDLDKVSEKDPTSVERSLMRRELARFNEFASLAENQGEALAKITEIKTGLRLLDY